MTARRYLPLFVSCMLAMPLSALAQDGELDSPSQEEPPLDAPTEEDPEPEVAIQGDAPTEEDPEPEVAVDASVVDGPAWDRIFAASVTLGIDTPLGIAGAAIEISPIRWVAFYAGVGIGRDGVRVGGGVRGQVPVGNAAVGLMVGLHAGPLDWATRSGTDAQSIHRWWEFALFLHTGLTFEYRWDEGFFGRLEFGLDALLEPVPATSCSFVESGESCADASLAQPIRPWAGLTVGYAF